MIESPQPIARYLDRKFSQWLIDNFSAGKNAADRDILRRLAEAVSYAVSIKHACLDLERYSALQEPVLDQLLAGITAQDVLRVVTADAVLPLIRSADGKIIWLQKYHAFESGVAAKLQLLKEQNRLEIITGGPGTGKTWTAAQRIQKILKDNPHSVIALAAPTGKAANNMMMALAKSGFSAEEHGLKGLTIHSLLGMNGGSSQPRRNKNNPLVCDVLIVDEASMIDSPMMYRLLQAIPSHATLLLLGDKDQLASVEAGSVLGAICSVFQSANSDVSESCVKELTVSQRYKNSPEIGLLAQALNSGSVADMHKNQHVLQHLLDIEHPWQPDWLEQALAAWKRIPYSTNDTAIADILQVQQHFQILCALREGPQGVAGINSIIEKALGKKIDSWYVGKPVMITRNDHSRKLYNGDVGIVLPVSEDGLHIDMHAALKACFWVDGKVKCISLAQMPAHDTCYAITIHKSQGSEYNQVMIVLPADIQIAHDNPVLTRELVYTAVTRAKTRIDLWCGEGVLEVIAKKTTQRMSGLADMLANDAVN